MYDTPTPCEDGDPGRHGDLSGEEWVGTDTDL